MIEINFNVWTYVKTATGQVAIRVNWEPKNEVTFSTGVWAEKKKWDSDRQKAKKMTTHTVKKHTFSSSEINERIADYKEEIESAFYTYSLKGSNPTPDELKRMVNAALGNSNEEKDAVLKPKSLDALLDEFLKKGTREKNWDEQCREKYVQAFNHFTAANPKIKVDTIDIDAMYRLRQWYVDEEYVNRTINKQFIMLKAILKFINEQDNIKIPDNVLNFETNFKVVKRVVTFMHYDELQKFENFKFKRCTERLSKVRDLWCFMAYTSLRYSDLVRLKPIHIIDGKRIEIFAEKTDEHLSIPLTEGALKIIKRRGGSYGDEGFLFDVPSNVKMNKSIKDAAQEAGLTRKIVNTYFIGTKRHEEIKRFCDIIGCHDARRTFVSCSLAMGIPPQVVMKCTGHTGYATMKPYIDTATETQSIEMEKWNRNQYKSQIISLLDKANEKELANILKYIKKTVVMKEDVVEEAKDDIEEIQDIEDIELNDIEEVEKEVMDAEVENEDFSIMDAMKSGQLFHIVYEPLEDTIEDYCTEQYAMA